MIYSRDRELDEVWMAAAAAWLRERDETLLSISYLYNSPTMNFALLCSLDQLRKVVHACPDGAELTLWRDVQLPVRGTISPSLLATARASIPEHTDCVCLFTESGSSTDPRLEGDSWVEVSHLVAELVDRMGEPVAIGAWPPSESMRAVKGGLEGPR